MRLQEKEIVLSSGAATTAMIDVIFILLIFFISVSQIKSSKLRIQLPEVTRGQHIRTEQTPRTTLLEFEITARNELYVEGQLVENYDDLFSVIVREKLRKARPDAETIAQIRADRASQSGALLRVLNELTRAGLTKIDFRIMEKVEPLRKDAS